MNFKKIFKKITKLFTFKKVDIVNATYINDELVITYSNENVEKYVGSSTVWHKLPMMERCSTTREDFLYDISKYIEKYGNPYPTAHKGFKLSMMVDRSKQFDVDCMDRFIKELDNRNIKWETFSSNGGPSFTHNVKYINFNVCVSMKDKDTLMGIHKKIYGF